MKLSTRSRYGTRIILELARRERGVPIQVSEISRWQNIPVKYLEQLIRTLKEAGLVKSTRGARGGHQLNQSPEHITVGQIVRLFEGQTDLVECVSAPAKCDMAVECLVRSVWIEATEALYERLDAVSIADLLESPQKRIACIRGQEKPE